MAEPMTPTPTPALDRELLRTAGEHLGTLAEREHDRLSWTFNDQRKRRNVAERYAKLARLSREVLEIANG